MVNEDEFSILDAIKDTAEQMRRVYRMTQSEIVLVHWKRDHFITQYGLEQVEDAERRWNIRWIDDWTEG